MKSEVVFGLEHAGWPALLVAASGAIRRANKSAIELFGLPLENETTPLSTIWSHENNSTPEQFLAIWDSAPTPTTTLKFKIGQEESVAYTTAICAVMSDGHKFFTIQLLPLVSKLTAASQNGETGIWHKQKLDCALQMARTVSLDFNNALASILGHTSFMLTKMEPGAQWRSSLLEVEKSAAKAAEIANDLATFSRQEKETRVQAAGNVNAVLQRCVEFFQRDAGPEHIIWTMQMERRLFAAKFDEAKMQQAFMKILENAVEALSGLGRITVQTRNLELTEATRDRNARLVAGAYICAEISDNGCGIEPAVLPRIFEPFFTTKKGSNNRGLGLAWVYGIITNHGGGVAVSSQPGKGTSVRVYLPAERRVVKDSVALTQDLSGSETILVVDDEDMLLTMEQTILESYGYKVLTANSGQKALEVLEEKEGAIDLVITDLIMPTMSGRELMEHMQRLSPGTRIIFTSGYVWPAGDANEPFYLQKPFTTHELLLKVKQVVMPETS